MNRFLTCSNSPLPSVVLPAYDLMVRLCGRPDAVISGFQTLLERECLEILLAGTAPITIYPARQFNPETDRLYNQQPKLWAAVRAEMAEGRVTIVEPPGMVGRRMTRENAVRRNEWLLTQVDEVLLLYAYPGGETERTVQRALDLGVPVKVLDHPANARWVEIGAMIFRAEDAT